MMMREPISRAAYWVLETAVEGRVPLMCLPNNVAASLFGRSSHGLAKETLLTLLRLLIERGDIVAVDRAGNQVRPSESMIRAELRFRPPEERTSCLCYQLTRQGADRWESIAQPRWERFVSPWELRELESDYELIEVVSQNRRLIDLYADLVYLRRDTRIVGSENWTLVEPWNATYWKQLPFGHCLRFCRKPTADTELLSAEARQFLKTEGRWYSTPRLADDD